ncbi:MAG TPA: LysR family transcriptional regulator [Noviherbaspirillum sp.]|nr:LysR family transcriptional regulator [Noviherbaspirillum sp.]
MKAHISTRLLYAFLALEELRHFTRAAERCHTSQSAFSVMIQKLEAAVGARLFERDTRKVVLTPEGELFAEVARSLTGEIESAFDDMADYVAKRRGRVAVAALPSLAARGMPAVLAEYRRRHPGVAVSLHDALSDQCLALLRQGRVDFVLTAPGPNVDEFESHILCSDPFYLVCRRDHPLAKKRSLKAADLADCELVHLVGSTSVRQHVDALLREVPTRHSGFEVEHLATLAGLVEQGLGVTIVPRLTLFQFEQLDLATVPIETRAHVRPILVVKRRDRSLSIAAQAMLDLVQAALGQASGGRQRA